MTCNPIQIAGNFGEHSRNSLATFFGTKTNNTQLVPWIVSIYSCNKCPTWITATRIFPWKFKICISNTFHDLRSSKCKDLPSSPAQILSTDFNGKYSWQMSSPTIGTLTACNVPIAAWNFSWFWNEASWHDTEI